mgnify:CR=1 FL=1|jgi:RimJ/RimL family protein N-acetyltransferase
MPTKKYLFTSKRLGFRNWVDDDIPKMTKISANPKVMRFFPSVASPVQTQKFVLKMQHLCNDKKFCYFAVDRLEDATFIGFIGLCEQSYVAPFTPCIDIGWRLDESFWGNGYATEGAEACLKYAFNQLNIPKIYAIASEINRPSIRVMEKIGMTKNCTFEHPKLLDTPNLKKCVCYEIEKGTVVADYLSKEV